jgi:hypothetical protein
LIAKIIPQPKKNDVIFMDTFAKKIQVQMIWIFFKKNTTERLEVGNIEVPMGLKY